jgi:hypothetical protein
MAISENWAELLEPGLRTIFNIQRDALAAESRIPLLFNVGTSNKAQEHGLGIGGFGDWQPYKGTIEYDDNEQGFKVTYTHQQYAKGFKVERALVDDDLYNIINERPRQLALGAVRTREKHAASVFNNAFSATYAGGDAVALCSASHPRSPSNASVQSNAGTTALSYNAVITTRRLMREYTDDRGELVPINPDTILVPPELEDTAWTIINTINKPGTADNDANFVSSRVRRVIVWDYLTDSNNWFMVDSAMAKMYLNWYDRVPLDMAMDPTSDFRLEARFRGYTRYSYGWDDWRWLYGHNVS